MYEKRCTIKCPQYCRFGESEERRNKDKKSGFELVVATFLHLKKPYQLLILPLTIWSGMEQGFFFSDYTAVSKMSSRLMRVSTNFGTNGQEQIYISWLKEHFLRISSRLAQFFDFQNQYKTNFHKEIIS